MGEVLAAGPLSVRLESASRASPSVVSRSFSVSGPLTLDPNASLDSPLRVQHLHLEDWPDHGVPDSAEGVALLSGLMRGGGGLGDAAAAEGPTVVHCSAGIGRSGVLCAVDWVSAGAHVHGEAWAAGARPEEVVVAAVAALRQQRAGMVQTPEQLAFAHEAALLALKQRLQHL